MCKMFLRVQDFSCVRGRPVDEARLASFPGLPHMSKISEPGNEARSRVCLRLFKVN